MSNLNKDYQPFLDSLDSLGFCTFRVFDDGTMDGLRKLYATHFENQRIDGLYASHNSNSVEKGLEISRSIRDIISGQMQNVFPDYDFFLGHFMVKGANVKSEFSLHQDWNIVDESKYRSYQVWIPLQLTAPSNGGMFVVPGSHRAFNNFRSGSYGIPFVPYQKEIDPIITSLIIPAGNVLIYHNALFHASHPNQTDQIRIAVIANFVEKKAPTYFFHKNPDKGKTKLYPITGDSLVANLPRFEKGMISADFKIGAEMNLSPVDNNKIAAADLIAQFERRFPHTTAAQVKQLHIAADPGLEDEINDKGYAVIDLLDDGEVQDFRREYQRHFAGIDRQPGRFTTLQDTDARMKKDIHEFIIKTVDPALQRHFKNYTVPVSQYYTKKAHTFGDIDLHADSTLLLNHQLEPHYAIWVPMWDVDEHNGCLIVIPDSHRNQKTVYGGSFQGRQQEHREWLRDYELPVPLRAGQAIVFDNNLLHTSAANSTDMDRVCITFRITHYASDYYSFICESKGSKDLSLYLEGHNYYMAEKWDGEGRHISGKFLGVLHDAIIDLKKNELLQKAEI